MLKAFRGGEATPSATSSESSIEAAYPPRSRSNWLRTARKTFGLGGFSRQPQADAGGESKVLTVTPRAIDASEQRRVSPGRAARAAAIAPAHLAAYARVLGAELPADRALLPLVIRLLSDSLPDGWLHGEDDKGARVYRHQRKQKPQYAHPNEQAHRVLLCEHKYGRGYVARCMAQLLPSPELDALRALPPDELDELAVRFGAYDRSAVGLVTLDDFVATVRRLGIQDGAQLSVRQIRALWERLDPSMLGVVDIAAFATAVADEAEATPESGWASQHGSRRGSAESVRDAHRALSGQAGVRASRASSPARARRRASPPRPTATSARGRAASMPRRGSLGSLEAGLVYADEHRTAQPRALVHPLGASPPVHEPHRSRAAGGGGGARSHRASAAESEGGGNSRRGSASSVASNGGGQRHIAIDIFTPPARADAPHAPRGPPTPPPAANWARLQLETLTERALEARRAPLEAQHERANSPRSPRLAPLHPERRRELLDAVERGRQRTASRGRAHAASTAGARDDVGRLQEYLSELRTNSEASDDSKRSSVGRSPSAGYEPPLEPRAASPRARARSGSDGAGAHGRGAHGAPSARDERRWAAGSLDAVFEQQPGLRVRRRSARHSSSSQEADADSIRQRPPLARSDSKHAITIYADGFEDELDELTA